MKKTLLLVVLSLTTKFMYANTTPMRDKITVSKAQIFKINENEILNSYKKLNFSEKLNYKIFKMAIKGYLKIKDKKTPYFIIIDYTKPSYEKRFFLLNMESLTIENNTYVAHGKNSGIDMAITFSNKMDSYKSSLGFYLTGETYNGKFGYSLKLHGLEQHYNSNAYKRGVIIHGADTSEEKYLKNYGFLGRTEGCPALPTSINKEILNKIKNGSVLFIFADDDKYLRDSKYIK